VRRDPRALVAALEIEDLATLVAGHRFGAVLDDEDGFWFVCPNCRHADHNRPTADVVDAWRWRCSRCRNSGTRYQLERLVLEDANLLARAYELVGRIRAA
jgi:predicted RNA-binding Zn-ribbon protein involved in translation (DUF1610 family)